jgi:hypothetical protein
MRPPECAVCGDEFTAPDGRLVTFAERDADRQWRERVAAERMVGHPPNVEWFCGVHAEAALALAGETIDVAMRALTATAAAVQQLTIVPRAIDDLLHLFRERMPALVGEPAASASRARTTSDRTWTPTDGAQPPYCPYVDLDVTTLTGRLGSIELRWDRAMWNDTEPARRTATLIVEPANGERCSVSATVGDGFEGSVGSTTTVLFVLGTPGLELQDLIDELAV